MSTAYPPRLIRYAFSSKKERKAAKAASMTPAFYGDFPSAFGLYYISPGKDFLSQDFQLSELSPDDPAVPREYLYAITFHKGPGLQQMTLYANNQHASTPMAIASNTRRFGSGLTITMPPTEANGVAQSEQVECKGFASDATHCFSIDGEDFEWREDRSTSPRKRRLIRLPSDAKELNGDAIYDPELVATWTEGAIPNRYGRLATFRLSDSLGEIGTSEALGKCAALVAVSVVLGACQSGSSIEGAVSWNQEKMLEKGHYRDKSKDK